MMSGHDHRGPYRVQTSRPIYENPWIRVREDRVRRPGGGQGLFGVVEMKPGSTVLALDGDERVHLVREHKYAIDAPSVELMSGGLDGEETPLEGARRELREELGLEAEEWTDLGTVHPFTTVVRSPNHMFLARRLTRTDASPDEGERIERIVLPLREAAAMVMRGEIVHAASCVCILKAERLLREHD